MNYFWKGEFFDKLSDRNGIYISKIENNSFYIGVYGETGDYSIYNDFIYHEDSSDEEQIPYFWMLNPFLNKHVDGLKNFDRDTLEIIVNAIERTYEIYLEFYDYLSKELDGNRNIKSSR